MITVKKIDKAIKDFGAQQVYIASYAGMHNNFKKLNDQGLVAENINDVCKIMDRAFQQSSMGA